MLAIIGGTGLNAPTLFQQDGLLDVVTPWSEVAVPVQTGHWQGKPCLFLPRHGAGHSIPPHKINYRANIWALREAGATAVVAVNAVGGIAPDTGPAEVILPHDVIDYTWGREHTYFDGSQTADLPSVSHVDVSDIYDTELLAKTAAAAKTAGIEIVDGGVFAITQGPRLETPAEINRLERDGCAIVGMTAMPEAALAKEIELPYVNLAVSVNWAAGRGEGDIHAEIEQSLAAGIAKVAAIITQLSSLG